MSVSLATLTAYADDLLQTSATPDYPNALNGLQLQNAAPIRSIAGAVDFSLRSIEGTIANGSNLLLLHHGMFWNGLKRLTESHYQRLKWLIDADIAVYSSHLPLDRHPDLGNNALMAKALGLEPNGQFARFAEILIGLRGECDIATEKLVGRVNKFAKTYGGKVRVSATAPGRRTQRWALCTGAGASSETLKEATSTGVDTLIVGEGPHHTAVEAEESGLIVIYAGHYATETLGVSALAQHLGERFGLPWHFVSAPTGL
ncbi:MAG: Nif3-like dinuclear metal center hexameric protein [Gemmatimonadaceae bacterium]